METFNETSPQRSEAQSGQSVQRRPGRPRAFDEEEVLGQVMDLFWKQGFFRTSTREIADATGLTLTSLSNAFGNKHQLFVRALDLYIDQMRDRALAPLLQPSAGLAQVRAVLEAAARSVEEGLFSRGCMVCNTALDLVALESDDVSVRVRSLLDDLEAAFATALGQAQQDGDVTKTISDHGLAKHLVVLFHGLSTQARCGASAEDLLGQIDVGLTLLRP